MVDLLGEHAAQYRTAVFEGDGSVMCDRLEQRTVVVGERRVAICDELADLPPAPTQRRAHGVRAGAAFRPRDPAVFEDERRTARLHGIHRRLDDRLERLLEVERLGYRL